MTPEEHVARAEELLEQSESSMYRPDLAGVYAARAASHIQAAQVIMMNANMSTMVEAVLADQARIERAEEAQRAYLASTGSS